jgi:Holliday junction resolvase
MIKSPKQKGNSFERQIAEALRDSGIEAKAQRQPMSGASGMLPGDIHSNRFTFECKFYKSMAIYKIWEQCIRAAKPTRPPVLALKANNKTPLIAMSLDDWIELVQYADLGGYQNR